MLTYFKSLLFVLVCMTFYYQQALKGKNIFAYDLVFNVSSLKF